MICFDGVTKRIVNMHGLHCKGFEFRDLDTCWCNRWSFSIEAGWYICKWSLLRHGLCRGLPVALKLLEMRQDIGNLCVLHGISKPSPGAPIFDGRLRWFTVSRHAQVNHTTGARILSQGFGFLNEQLTKQMRMLQSEYLSRYFNIMRKHDSQTWSLQNLHRLLPSPDETTPPGVWLARESPKSWSLPWGFTGAVCTEGILWWNLFVRHTVP